MAVRRFTRRLAAALGSVLIWRAIDDTGILESEKEDDWVDEDRFEVKGDSSTPVRGGPKRARQRREQQAPLLLAEYTLHLVGDFVLPSKESVAEIAKAAGANVLGPVSPKFFKATPSTVVLTSPDWLTNHADSVRHYNPVNVSWLFDSVAASQVLALPQYLVCP